MKDELERLKEELTQARLDLLNSDAIREALVKQTTEIAKDMARALSMVESAFHAGYRYGTNNGSRYCDKYFSASEAYREWNGELQGADQTRNDQHS